MVESLGIEDAEVVDNFAGVKSRILCFHGGSNDWK